MKKSSLRMGALMVLVVFIFGCLLPMPYGYYKLMRVICTVGFYWLVSFEYEAKRIYLLIPSIICLILFNFIIPIHFEKEVWQVIDIIVGALLLGWLIVEIIAAIRYKQRGY